MKMQCHITNAENPEHVFQGADSEDNDRNRCNNYLAMNGRVDMEKGGDDT